MIKGENVSLFYGSKEKPFQVLKNISFNIEKARITSFIGRSGAGKTSLLKCVANLICNYTGNITFENKNIKLFTDYQRVSHIGFVFQQFHLFPHLSVLQNCVQPLITVLDMPKDKDIVLP